MNKRLTIVIATIIVTFLFTPSAHAQTPTPTTTPAITEVKVDGGTASERIPLSKPEQFAEKIKGVFQPIRNVVNINFSGTIKPAGNKLKTFDLDRIAGMLQGADAPLTPKIIQEKTINFDPGQYPLAVTGRSRICVTNPDTGKTETRVSPDIYRTDPIPALNYLSQYGRRLRSFFTPAKQENQDYTETPQVIGDNIPDCQTDDQGKEQLSKSQATTGQNTFDDNPPPSFFVNVVSKFLGLISKFTNGTLTVQGFHVVAQHTPYADEIDCSLSGAGCGSEGGLARTFAPAVHDPTRGEINGSQNNTFDSKLTGTTTTETRTARTKSIENSGNYIGCAVMPKSLQGPECQQNWQGKGAKGGSCEGKQLPDLSVADNSCSLCHVEEIDDFIKKVNPDYANQLPEGKLPQTAIDVLNKAAQTYKVPAAVILGAMIHEGAFTWDDWKWTEKNSICWAVDGGKIGQKTFGDDTSCKSHAHPATGARGAFGWMDYWFDKVKDSVRKIDPGRQIIDQCNIVDGAMALANSMYQTQGGDAAVASSCQGIPLLQGAGRAASCRDWDEKRAATAQFTFNGRLCTPAVPRTVNAFKKFYCK